MNITALNPNEDYKIYQFESVCDIPKYWIQVPLYAEKGYLTKVDTVIFTRSSNTMAFCDDGLWRNISLNLNDDTIKEVYNNCLYRHSFKKPVDIRVEMFEKWLNGEKVQYKLGGTQWHTMTEGALRFMKRSDIELRVVQPKLVEIDGHSLTKEAAIKFIEKHY